MNLRLEYPELIRIFDSQRNLVVVSGVCISCSHAGFWEDSLPYMKEIC
jgi:hypothetical protein